ncbi:MAG: hypothetical protein IPJ13_17665 [Saprospiraceae bacterium]|nr:hypothetical protein [Saprospiraceae bacterium]
MVITSNISPGTHFNGVYSVTYWVLLYTGAVIGCWCNRRTVTQAKNFSDLLAPRSTDMTLILLDMPVSPNTRSLPAAF